MVTVYRGIERREFPRYEHERPVYFRTLNPCNPDNPTQPLGVGISKNVSASGVLFKIKAEKMPSIPSLISVTFDYKTSEICDTIESRNVIDDNRLFGNVARIGNNGDGTCDVGIEFVTKENHFSKGVKELAQNKI